jgi:phage shock protein C
VNERLYRSRDDRMLAGVAGGLAELLDADPSLIRVVWAVLVVLTGGLALLVYVVMAIVVPERPAGTEPRGAAAPPGPDGPQPAGTAPAGSWLAPDGSTVPIASTPAPRAGRRSADDAARGGLIAGLLLIVLGGFFLLRQLIPAFDLGAWWPVAAIGLGIVLIVLAVTPSRRPD